MKKLPFSPWLMAPILCITVIELYALYLGRDGVALSGAIAGIVAITSGGVSYLIGRARHIREHPRDK